MNNLDEMIGPDLAGRPSFDAEIIRLNGKDGGFYTISGQKLGSEISIIPLRARRILVGFERRNNEMIRYFTNEHNHWREVISLFEVKENGSPKFLDTGTSAELKERWPKLRMNQVLYCLLDEKIIKLMIKGASLANWFVFRDSLEERACNYLIKVGQVEEESSLGNYFAMNFKIERKLNEEEFKKVIEKIQEVHQKLTKIDNYYKTRGEEIEKEISEEVSMEDIPVVENEDLTEKDKDI